MPDLEFYVIKWLVIIEIIIYNVDQMHKSIFIITTYNNELLII